MEGANGCLLTCRGGSIHIREREEVWSEQSFDHVYTSIIIMPTQKCKLGTIV